MPTSLAEFFKRFKDVLPTSMREQITRLYNSWTTKKLDGKVTPREFLDFIDEALEELMLTIDGLADGKTKKAIVLEFAGLLFDFFAPLIVARWSWLGWLIYILGGTDIAREAFLDLASLLIEAIFQAKLAKRSTP